MASIADLIRVSPPPDRGAQNDWTSVDAELGFVTPTDYRQIVDTYGRGLFGDFLWVMLPSDDQPRISLGTQIESARQSFQLLAEILAGSVPEALPPYDVNTLIPCAATNNGDTIYWITDRATSPDRWPVTVQPSRDPAWDEFDGPLLDFLVAVFIGEHGCPAFPPEFPAASGMTFTPLARD
jgi:hypothetical protein